MKKLLPLLILTLFLASCAPNAQYVGEQNEKGEDHGTRTKTWASGEKYEGEWKNGKRNGVGTYTYSNGFKYVGEWKDDYIQGKGTLTSLNGEFNGLFNNGIPYKGIFTALDGALVEGYWTNKKRGYGRITFADGSVYLGEWNSDTEVLRGSKEIIPNYWYMERPYGLGIMNDINGQTKSGIWSLDNSVEELDINIVLTSLKNRYPQFNEFNYVAPTPVLTPDPIPVITALKSSGVSLSGFIAVIEFEGNNISSGEVRALTDRLRSELVTIGEFTIIERGKMDEVLKEQAFQQTGCVSSECAVEVGKLLGVENIITGSISRVGTIYSVSARAFSVASGEIIKIAVYDHSGDIGGLLTQGMRKVAEELGK